MFSERYALKLTAKIWYEIQLNLEAEVVVEDSPYFQDASDFSISHEKDRAIEGLSINVPEIQYDCPLCEYVGMEQYRYNRDAVPCMRCPLLKLWMRNSDPFDYEYELVLGICESAPRSPYGFLQDDSEYRDPEDLLEAIMDIHDAALTGYEWWVNLKEMNEV